MAEPDLRAEVLAGLDRKSHEITSLSLYADDLPPRAKDTLTALRHLREIVERHEHPWEGNGDFTGNYWACWGCNRRVKRGTWCPVIRALAHDYAPQALK